MAHNLYSARDCKRLQIVKMKINDAITKEDLKVLKKLILITVLLAMTACVPMYSETPIAKNFATSHQEKLQAASHWAIITQDLSRRLQEGLANKVRKTQAVYVSTKEPSEFNQAVVAELISSLVAKNYSVVKTPKNAIKIDVSTQVLSFSAKRIQAHRIGIPTFITAGLWALSESNQSVTPSGLASTFFIGSDVETYVDNDHAKGPTPKTEIIINLSAFNGDRYLATSTSTYYVSDTDKWLYQAAATKSFSVIGSN